MGLVSSLKEWLFRGHISSRGRQNLWKKSIVCHSAKNILGITGIFTWKRKRKRTLYHRFYTMKKKLTFPCCHRSILYVCVMFAEKKFLFSSTTGLHSLFWRPPSVKKKKQKKHRFVKSINANFFFLNSWGCVGDGDGKIDLGKVMSPFVESQFESSQSKQPIFVRPPLVSLRNDVWATTAEMSHFRVPKISLSKRGCVELCCENEFYLHHN